MTRVHVVVPEGIDNPQRPSGGNVYDRRICGGLTALGWSVHEFAIPGRWPDADTVGLASLTEVLGAVPNDGVVLLDGLIGSAAPEVLMAEADRLRLVVVVHMPLGATGPAATTVPTRVREREALTCADAVVTTSRWTCHWLLDNYGLPDSRFVVVHPGVDSGPLVAGTAAGGQLLCVAAVVPAKGHDILLSALTRVKDLDWNCVCVGSLDLDPGFVADLRAQAHRNGIADRVTFTGPLVGARLADAYSRADVLVLASRAETYGMVVTEGLARGIPVVATDVGGVSEAVGWTVDGVAPALLVPPGETWAFAAALRSWLVDEDRRRRLRQAAEQRRQTLTGWEQTARLLSRRLADVAGGEPVAHGDASHGRYRPAANGASR